MQALDATGAAFEEGTGSGDPLVCQLVTTNGEGEITSISATTWTNEEWAQGAVTKTPMNPGKVIPGHMVDGSAVGFGEYIFSAKAMEAEVEEEDDEQMDADFQGRE